MSNLPEDVSVGDDDPPPLEKPEYCNTSWGDRRLLARLDPGSAPYLGPPFGGQIDPNIVEEIY